MCSNPLAILVAYLWTTSNLSVSLSYWVPELASVFFKGYSTNGLPGAEQTGIKASPSMLAMGMLTQSGMGLAFMAAELRCWLLKPPVLLGDPAQKLFSDQGAWIHTNTVGDGRASLTDID